MANGRLLQQVRASYHYHRHYLFIRAKEEAHTSARSYFPFIRLSTAAGEWRVGRDCNEAVVLESVGGRKTRNQHDKEKAKTQTRWIHVKRRRKKKSRRRGIGQSI